MNSDDHSPSTDADLDHTLRTLAGELSSALDRSPKEPDELRARLNYVAHLLVEAGPLPDSAALVYRKAGEKVKVIPLDKELLVGRSSGCGLKIEGDRELSKKHFRIFREGDAFWVENLNSTNGTFVNDDRQLASQRRLRSGDILLAGNLVFVFVTGQNQLDRPFSLEP